MLGWVGLGWVGYGCFAQNGNRAKVVTMTDEGRGKKRRKGRKEKVKVEARRVNGDREGKQTGLLRTKTPQLGQVKEVKGRNIGGENDKRVQE